MAQLPECRKPCRRVAPWAWGVLIFAFSFAIRAATVAAMRDLGTGPVGAPGQDDVDFHQLATHLVDGTGYAISPGRPTSFRAPGFPLMLAGVSWLAPGRAPAAYLSFCLLGAISCLLVYLLAREFFAERWARVPAFSRQVTCRTSTLRQDSSPRTCLCLA